MDFTKEECRAIADIISDGTGGNPEYVFANDGTDSLEDPVILAFVKLYTEAGMTHLIPKNLRRRVPIWEVEKTE